MSESKQAVAHSSSCCLLPRWVCVSQTQSEGIHKGGGPQCHIPDVDQDQDQDQETTQPAHGGPEFETGLRALCGADAALTGAVGKAYGTVINWGKRNKLDPCQITNHSANLTNAPYLGIYLPRS